MLELETKVHPKIRNHRITQPNLNLGTFYDTELNSEGEGPVGAFSVITNLRMDLRFKL